MSEKVVLEYGQSELEQLVALAPTVAVEIPMYEGDGRTRLRDDQGRLVEGRFTLHRPTPAEGIAFGKFLQGATPDDAPSQQAIACRAVQTVIPTYHDSTDGDVLLVLVQTGGYLGSNAELANACLGVLGINLTGGQDEPESRWASDDQLPG